MLTRRSLLVLLGSLAPAVAGCSVAPVAPAPRAPGPGATTPTATTTARAEADAEQGARVVDALRAAFASGDRAGFVALAVPELRTRLAVLFDNWQALSSVELSHRRMQSGGAGELVVRWTAGPEVQPAEHALELRLAPLGPASPVPALVDLSDARRPAACWSRHPIAVASAGPVSVVSTLPDLTAPTLDAASWAAARLAEAGLDAFDWDGSLVVEVPFDLVEFTRLGNSSVALPGVAALSLSTTAESAYRVVRNPVSVLGEEDLRGVLLHEGVHAATRAMWLDAPLWAVEGLAESVATRSWPSGAARNAEMVRAAAHTASALPSADDLAAVGEEGNAAYALAEVGVEAMVARWGAQRVHAWIANWSAPDRPDDETLTATFLQALPR